MSTLASHIIIVIYLFIFSQYVRAEFICAVQPILKERWTAELQEAWKVRSL